MRTLTLSLIQKAPRLGDLEANLRMAEAAIEQAADAGGQLICFPELFLTGYHPDLIGERWSVLAQRLDGPALSRLSSLAGQRGVAIVVGFAQCGSVPGEITNAAAVIGPQGRIIGSYAKMHAFGSEGRWFSRGHALPVFDVLGVRLGVMICYDAGFPEVARSLAIRGAELLVVPAAWIDSDEDLWQLNIPSRALDNLVFAAGVNRVGEEGSLAFIGRSLIVGPRGQVLAQAAKWSEEILTYRLDLDQVQMARSQVGYWRDRRPD